MGVSKEAFGSADSGLGFMDETERHGIFSWLKTAHFVAAENGCPQPDTVMKGYMESGGLDSEKASELYVRNHMPHNFWWGGILEMAQERNPELYEEMIHLKEKGGSEFDVGRVPQGYLDIEVGGLATEGAYAVTTAITLALMPRSSSENPVDKIDHVLGVVDGALGLKTFTGFKNRIMRELALEERV